MNSDTKLIILVATMTGNASLVADDISDFCTEKNLNNQVLEMDNLDIAIFNQYKKSSFLICSSTYGQGDVPDNAKSFYDKLDNASLNLSSIRYALFGLGDMTYKDTFAFGGKKFDKLMNTLNAERIACPYYHDASSGTLPEEEALEWFKENIINNLNK